MATKIGNLYAFCAFFKTADKLLKKFISWNEVVILGEADIMSFDAQFAV